MSEPLNLPQEVHEVVAELARAEAKFPRFNSAHEGWAVLREEVDELWDAIKGNDLTHARKEAIQVAAMALRYLRDVGGSRAPAAKPEARPPRRRADGRGRPSSPLAENALRMLEVLGIWITPAELAHHLAEQSRPTHKRLQSLYLAGRIARRPRPFRHGQVEYEYGRLSLLPERAAAGAAVGIAP